MSEPTRPTNQTLLLQIVRDIEILKANSIQILEASRDHENRIRDLEKQQNRTAWIPALITAVVTSVAVFLISRGLK
jgi:type IV secretory pathway component VirB8